MSPDQLLIWGATRVTRNNEECAGILPREVGPVDLWSVPFLLSCGSAVVCSWGPSLLSQCRQGIGFSNLPMLRLGLRALWSSWPWFQGPQVHDLPWVRPWPQKMSCARVGLGPLEIIWSQVCEWPCCQRSLSHFSKPRICLSWGASALSGAQVSFFFLGLWLTRDRLVFRHDFPDHSCGSSMVWPFSRSQVLPTGSTGQLPV